ncbi:Uncharacterised protein [Mycobacteroides abscessus subsp. abscessus]|nr:Uncharacterised protein [Mycobacteroides abscessus subsp. abscessus]
MLSSLMFLAKGFPLSLMSIRYQASIIKFLSISI